MLVTLDDDDGISVIEKTLLNFHLKLVALQDAQVKHEQLVLLCNKKPIKMGLINSCEVLDSEIDRVQHWWFPLDDLIASAWIIRTRIDSKDYSVVFVTQCLRFDQLKDAPCVPHLKHVL